jgi:hypothetical protein
MLIHFLDRFEPADQPLLDLIFEHVDDSMLFDMAKADYGDDVDLHLAALHQIRANGNEATIAAFKFLSWRMKCQMQRDAIDEDFGECPCYAIAIGLSLGFPTLS